MKLTRIRVPAAWTEPSGNVRFTPAEFTLGPGPCGKTVTNLGYTVSEGVLSITQAHDDGTARRFFYPLGQLTGRIETDIEP